MSDRKRTPLESLYGLAVVIALGFCLAKTPGGYWEEHGAAGAVVVAVMAVGWPFFLGLYLADAMEPCE